MKRAALFAFCLLALASVEAAKKNAIPEVIANGPVGDVLDAVMELVGEVSDAVQSIPRVVADFIIQGIRASKGLPVMIKNVSKGDASTLTWLADFCSKCGTIFFAVWATSAALNTILLLVNRIIKKIESCLVVSSKIPGHKFFNKMLGLLKGWDFDYLVPLQGSEPDLSGIASQTTGAIAIALLLSSAPAIAAVLDGSHASLADVQQLAWTLGLALGIKYLNKLGE